MGSSKQSFLENEFSYISNFHISIQSQSKLMTSFVMSLNALFIPLTLLSLQKYKCDYFTSIIAVIVSIVLITVTMAMIKSLINLRRREVWIYDKLNLLRSIVFDNELNISAVEEYYLNSKYGKCNLYSTNMSFDKFKNSSFCNDALVLSYILSIWFLILITLMMHVLLGLMFNVQLFLFVIVLTITFMYMTRVFFNFYLKGYFNKLYCKS